MSHHGKQIGWVTSSVRRVDSELSHGYVVTRYVTNQCFFSIHQAMNGSSGDELPLVW